MDLIEFLDSTDLNQINIHEGAGAFLLEGGLEKKDKAIRISYYKPERLIRIQNSNCTAWCRSKMVMIIEMHGLNMLIRMGR